MKDYWKTTLILSLLFMGMSAMYSGMYPGIKDVMADMMESDYGDTFAAFKGSEDMASYLGFLNIELYQIFWILILGILLGMISASIISKEVEAKTIDLFMANPISRKQIIIEKFLGLTPMILIINFSTFLAVSGMTIAIDEEINFGYLFMTHVVSIPYLLAVISIGLLISVIIDEKMKASIVMIAILVGMFIFESISMMAPDYESLGYISLTHYFNPYDILKSGTVDAVGIVVLIVVILECLLVSMFIFERRDINVS
jgi:ABC-2 type transport system permease protein